MLMNEECDGRPIGPVYEARTWGKRRGVLVTDGALWIEQRKFLLRHLRNFGFGKNDMATMIEEETMYLVNNLMKQLESSSTMREKYVGFNDSNNNVNNKNNCIKNEGRIYQLSSQKLKKKSSDIWQTESLNYLRNSSPKTIKIEDMYMKAEDYAEVRKLRQTTEMIVQMDEVFGVSILNTLWRMMAGKRFVNL